MNVVETLLKSSLTLTNKERKEHRVLPEQWEKTLAQYARMRTGSLAEKKKHEATQKFLTILAEFPILDTQPLISMQSVKLIGHSVEFPLYGMVPWGKDRLLIQVWADTAKTNQLDDLRASVKVGRWSDDPLADWNITLPGYHDCLTRAMMSAIYLRINKTKEGRSVDVVTMCPSVPARIKKAAGEAAGYGFTDIAVIWGPSVWAVEEKPAPKDDPLLVGRLFDRWWILDQWDPTDAEKRLVNAP